MGLIKKLFSRRQDRTYITTSEKLVPVWSSRDYNNFCKETFFKNVISFRCIDLISKSVASVPWKLYNTKKDGYREEVVNHPLLTVFKRPNPTQGMTALIQSLIGFLEMAGNGYLQRISPITGPNKGIPKELWVLRPDRIKIVADDKNNVAGYEYRINENNTIGYSEFFPVDPITMQSDLLQLKLFNPMDDFYGAAVTESVAREVDTSNEATAWNMSLLQNGCRPGMILTYKQNLTDQQFQRIQKQFKENHAGGKNAGKNLILEGESASAIPYGLSPLDMDFGPGDDRLARKIALGYGVPPMLLGIAGDTRYTNFKEARLAFWEETIFYLLGMLKTELNNWFFQGKGTIELDFDLSQSPAMSVQQDAMWDRAEKTNFISINEKRELVGKEKVEGGDAVLIPISLMPLGSEMEDTENFEGIEKETAKNLAKRGKTKEEIDEMMSEDEL